MGNFSNAGLTLKKGVLSSANSKVYFDLNNSELHCNKLISTSPYSNVQNVVAEIVGTQGLPVKYYDRGYGLNIYSESYTNDKFVIQPRMKNGQSYVYLTAISENKDLGIQLEAITNPSSSTVDNSSIALDPNGNILLTCRGSSVDYPFIDLLPSKSSSDTSDILIGAYDVSIDVRDTINLGRSGGSVYINRTKVTGTKSRLVETNDYNKRLLYCYEMPSPMFGDIGEGQTDESGICLISIDDIFSQTARTDFTYHIFLQKEGNGDLWIEEKTLDYFIVKGTPNLSFSWELKAKQKDFETLRLEDEDLESTTDKELLEDSTEEDSYLAELNEYILEMEAIYNETT